MKKSLRQFFWVGIRLVYTARKGISTVATALEPHKASNALLQDSIFQKRPQSTQTHRKSVDSNNNSSNKNNINNNNNINRSVSHVLSTFKKLSCLSVFSNQPPLVSLLLYFAALTTAGGLEPKWCLLFLGQWPSFGRSNKLPFHRQGTVWPHSCDETFSEIKKYQ